MLSRRRKLITGRLETCWSSPLQTRSDNLPDFFQRWSKNKTAREKKRETNTMCDGFRSQRREAEHRWCRCLCRVHSPAIFRIYCEKISQRETETGRGPAERRRVHQQLSVRHVTTELSEPLQAECWNSFRPLQSPQCGCVSILMSRKLLQNHTDIHTNCSRTSPTGCSSITP